MRDSAHDLTCDFHSSPREDTVSHPGGSSMVLWESEEETNSMTSVYQRIRGFLVNLGLVLDSLD